MPLHAVMTGFPVALAAAPGSAITHVDDVLPKGSHWLLCGEMAGYFAAGPVAALTLGDRADRVRLLGWALPCVAGPWRSRRSACGCRPGRRSGSWWRSSAGRSPTARGRPERPRPGGGAAESVGGPAPADRGR